MNEVVPKDLDTLRDMVSQSEIDWDDLFGAAESVAQDLSTDSGVKPEEAVVAAVVCAVAAFHLGRWSSAHAWVSRAIELDPSSFEANEFFAFLSAQASSPVDAAYYMKAAGAHDPSPLEWFHNFFADNVADAGKAFAGIEQDALLQKGRQFMALGHYNQAEECFRGHLAFHPESVDAYLAISMCLMAAGQYLSAQHNLRAAIHIFPKTPAIAVALGQTLYGTGDYAAGRQAYEWAMQYQTDFVIQASYLLNRLTDPQDDDRALERVYRESIAGVLHHDESDHESETYSPPITSPVTSRSLEGVLKIGYLVSEQRDFMESWGLASIIAAHNPVNVRVIGFGEGALSDSQNCLFQHCFSSWRDIRGIDSYTFRHFIQGEGVDVFVDTAGLLSPQCLEALTFHPAPLQISWSGIPWDPGSGVFDAVFSDSHLLECSSVSACDSACRPLSGGAMFPGLPSDDRPLSWRDGDDEEIILGCPIRFYEMSYTAVALAAACLHRIPESKLVLPGYDFSSEEVVSRLLMLFGTFGVAHRVDLIDVEDEQSFALECDIVLSPPSPWAIGRVVAALWAGVPVVAWAPRDRRLRRVSSFLTAAGLEKMCASESMEGVAVLAEHWVENLEERLSFRDEIRNHLIQSPPFQYKERCGEIENIYKELYCRKEKVVLESEA